MLITYVILLECITSLFFQYFIINFEKLFK